MSRRSGTALLLAIALGASLAVAPTSPAGAAEAPPVFTTTWGSEGSANGQFIYPWGIGIDSNGILYVADRDNHRIQKFSADGTYLAQWGSYGPDPGQFKNPYGVVVDADDFVYVADTSNDRIQKFTTNGDFVDQWGTTGGGNGQFNHPQGVALEADGNLLVADGENDRIQRFSATGTYLGQWGATGTGAGQFKYPRDVAVGPTGTVYVADTNNNRIQRFTPSGTFLGQWGGFGTAPAQFAKPFSVRTDSTGAVYVADYENDRVQKFTARGAYLTEWGGEGSGNGQFREPQSLSVDAQDNLYVSDSDNGRIQKFAPAGTGTVTGTVSVAGAGTPVPGAWVVLLTESFAVAGAGTADGSGNFSVTAPAGTYFLYAIDPSGVGTAGFHGAPTSVVVTAGGSVDVDPTLQPARGAIQGSVSDADSHAAIPGAWAVALNGANATVETLSTASGSGAYTLSPLRPGSHYVAWVDPTGAHAARMYPSSGDFPGATTVPVAAGAATAADGSLPAMTPLPGGAALTGTITEDGTGTPLAGVHVLALRSSDYRFVRGAVTNGAGAYSLDLPTNTSYVLEIFDSTGRHGMEWYDDQPPNGLAQAQPATAPGTANASLARITGTISGTVTDAGTGNPVVGAWVIAIASTGVAGGAVTSASGTYQIADLPPGTYRITFADPAGGRAQEYWNGASDYASATPFAVAAGATVVRDADLVGP